MKIGKINLSFFLGNYHRDGVCIALGGLSLSSEDSRASSTRNLPIFTYWIKCETTSDLLFFNHPAFLIRQSYFKNSTRTISGDI